MRNFNKLRVFLTLISISCLTPIAAEPLTEIVVTAELLETSNLQLPNSVSVIGSQDIEDRSAHHLEELLNLAPNVNFSSGASRGRFIQIRGIGERSEFQEPIINSVGIIVDGIDMTGISTAASTLDIEQVEILRGPQGTLFGANALAGLINVVSNKPSKEKYAQISSEIEDYDGFGIGAIFSSSVLPNSAYRLAFKHYQSNGFTNNNFLNKDDTNNLNETTARFRYENEINDTTNYGITLFLADINNGYDAFSLDNTRQTLSDQPGVDRQETQAFAFKLNHQINQKLRFEGLVSSAKSKLEYSYDEDWANNGICINQECDSSLFGFDWFYSSFDQYKRDNSNSSFDIKLISNINHDDSWLIGIYHRDQDIGLERVYTFSETDFSSSLRTKNTAIYGQLNKHLNDDWSITTGLRYEQKDFDYSDNSGNSVTPDENQWGGRFALEYLSDSGVFYYGLISRGYKSGGFNLNENILASQREFDSETMINYELGIKHSLLNDQLQFRTSLFYQDRKDIQTKQSIVSSASTGQIGGDCPCSFTDFTDNATSGNNIGAEFEFNWATNDYFNLFGSLGLLNTKFDQFLTFEHVNADRENAVPFNLVNRAQSHAPQYQFNLGATAYINSNWSITASIEGKDEFYFSDRHDEKSGSYELLNMQLSYKTDTWELTLYGKNISDELVKTRGFGSFGNDPRKFYVTEPYNQFSMPRLFGLKASMEF